MPITSILLTIHSLIWPHLTAHAILSPSAFPLQPNQCWVALECQMTRELHDSPDGVRHRETRDFSEAAVFVTKVIERERDTLVTATTTISRSAAELYCFWRNFSHLPGIIDCVSRVVLIDSQRSLWSSCDYKGDSIDWIVSITHDHHNKLIAWATDRPDLVGSGRVKFETLPSHSTEVILTILQDSQPGRTYDLLNSFDQSGPIYETCNILRVLQEKM